MAASNNKLDDVIRRLSRNDATLTTLDLRSNQVGAAEAGRLAEALKINSTLIILHLEGNEVADEGVERLAEALASNSTLTTLNLGYNGMGAEGAGRLAEVLTINSTLTTLDLSFNLVGAAGAGRLADALASNSTLTTLDFEGNEVGDEGAEALVINSTLTTLNLYGNDVGGEGAGRLAKAVASNFTLTQLHFNWAPNTRRLVDAYLNRNKDNLERKSASLFFMLLLSLSLDDEVLSEKPTISLDVSIAVEDQSPSSKRQRRT